ncbi:MAG: acyl--CoA ligase [Nitrospirae bacterium]|nr:acyl--CoA ligase [Nitrospirota bacterium]
MSQLRAWHRAPGAEPRTAPFFKKLNAFILRDGEFSLSTFVDLVADVYGERTVLFLEGPSACFSAKTLSYNEARRFVERAAGALAGRGVKKGDRVVLFMGNSVELGLLAFAVMRLGAVVIPVNAQYRSAEVDYIITHSRAGTVITDATTRSSVSPGAPGLTAVRNWLDLDPKAPSPFESLSSLLAAAAPAPPAPLADDDPVGIFYTSGTTGHPKGAVLTNKGFMFHIRRSLRMGTLIPKRNIHAILHALPLTHIMGFLVFMAFFCSGSPIVFLGGFEAGKAIEAIERYGITLFVGVPAMYGMILQEKIPNGALQTMRVMVSAADVLPPEWAERIRQLASRPFLGLFRKRPIFAEFYGQVETTGVTCAKLSLPFVKYDAGCVGRRMPGVEVKIIGADGKEVRKGEVGEVVVKGDNVLQGYWGSAEQKDVFTADGWFRTGDLAKKGSLGFFYFVDREKDMIKSGGYSIFTREVEELLMSHPQILEASVFGIPHAVKKEIPVAAVRLKPGESVAGEEIVEWAKQHIAPYKSPRKVVVVDDFPRGSTQKILKKELKRLYAHLGEALREEAAAKAS